MTAKSKGGLFSEAVVDQLAVQAGGDALKLASLAARALEHGHSEKAYSLARAARGLAPDDPEVASLTGASLAAGVAPWHFGIVRDEIRNEAYDAALRRAVDPGTRVLDIGAGTGLLAMMAARAGAGAVASCEMNRAVADAAAEIVALNGYSERIRIIAKHSADIDPDSDMGGRADVLVSEIISNDVLGQSVLPVMEDAAARLLKPGGKMIPASARLRVALAHWSGLDERLPGEAAGFDISPFHRLDRVPRRLGRGDEGLTVLSEPADLFAFDFASGGPFAPERATLSLRAGDGPVNGIVQWIHLRLDDLTDYENDPAPGRSSCWACLFYPLKRELEAKAGRLVTVHGAHNRRTLHIWAEAGPADGVGA
jgi:type III protein arginine methyltransferase